MQASFDFVWIQPLITFNCIRLLVYSVQRRSDIHKLDKRIDRLYRNGCLTLTHYLQLDKMLAEKMDDIDHLDSLSGQG